MDPSTFRHDCIITRDLVSNKKMIVLYKRNDSCIINKQKNKQSRGSQGKQAMYSDEEVVEDFNENEGVGEENESEVNQDEYIDSLNKKILSLNLDLDRKSAEIILLKSTINCKNSVIDASMKSDKIKTKNSEHEEVIESALSEPSKEKKKSKKTIFYEEHKDDDEVIAQIKLFETTFPGIKMPKQMVRAITNFVFIEYKKEEM